MVESANLWVNQQRITNKCLTHYFGSRIVASEKELSSCNNTLIPHQKCEHEMSNGLKVPIWYWNFNELFTFYVRKLE